MSWFSDRTGVHLNLRPLAPILGGIVGNAILPGIGGAALGAGLGRFADGVGNRESLGQAAKAGAITGGLTYGGGKALEAVRGAFAPSSAVAGVPSGGGYAAEGGGMPVGVRPPVTNPSGVSAGFSMGNAAQGIGSFLEKNPMAASMGLQAAGNLTTAGAQNDLARAQAHRLDTENNDADYELSLKKARDAALDPIRQMLLGQFANPTKRVIAPNPYTGV